VNEPDSTSITLPENGRVVFFDGVCGLCNQFVDHVLRHDREGRLLFAPLQGKTFLEVQQRHPELARTDSMIYLIRQDGEETLRLRSDASIGVMKELGGWDAVIARFLNVCPRAVRDLGYRFVAAIRYRVFGKRATCRMPTPEERARFLP